MRSCDDRMIQKVHQTIGRHGDGSMEAPALQLVKYICKVTMETNPRLLMFLCMSSGAMVSLPSYYISFQVLSFIDSIVVLYCITLVCIVMSKQHVCC